MCMSITHVLLAFMKVIQIWCLGIMEQILGLFL